LIKSCFGVRTRLLDLADESTVDNVHARIVARRDSETLVSTGAVEIASASAGRPARPADRRTKIFIRAASSTSPRRTPPTAPPAARPRTERCRPENQALLQHSFVFGAVGVASSSAHIISAAVVASSTRARIQGATTCQ
jgi:hypothetical protein